MSESPNPLAPEHLPWFITAPGQTDGLFVAMIGLVFFNGLHNRVRLVVHQLDTLKTALVNRLTSDIPDVHVAREAETETPHGVIGSLARRGA